MMHGRNQRPHVLRAGNPENNSLAHTFLKIDDLIAFRRFPNRLGKIRNVDLSRDGWSNLQNAFSPSPVHPDPVRSTRQLPPE
jgi:hypothetical protein